MPNFDHIRLVYIGSPHKALAYAVGHLPAPPPRPDQILAIHDPAPLMDIHVGALPYWCHIGTELHNVNGEIRPAISDAVGLFNDIKARRQPPPHKAGV